MPWLAIGETAEKSENITLGFERRMLLESSFKANLLTSFRLHFSIIWQRCFSVSVHGRERTWRWWLFPQVQIQHQFRKQFTTTRHQHNVLHVYDALFRRFLRWHDERDVILVIVSENIVRSRVRVSLLCKDTIGAEQQVLRFFERSGFQGKRLEIVKGGVFHQVVKHSLRRYMAWNSDFP